MADLSLDNILEEIISSLHNMALTFSVGVAEGIFLLVRLIPVFIQNFFKLVLYLILALLIFVRWVVFSFCETVAYIFNLIVTSESFINLTRKLSNISSGTSAFMTEAAHQTVLYGKVLLFSVASYVVQLFRMIYSTSIDVLFKIFNYLLSSTTIIFGILSEKLQLAFHRLLGLFYSVMEASYVFVDHMINSSGKFFTLAVKKLVLLDIDTSTVKQKNVLVQPGFNWLQKPYHLVLSLFVVIAIVILLVKLLHRGVYAIRYNENEERPQHVHRHQRRQQSVGLGRNDGGNDSRRNDMMGSASQNEDIGSAHNNDCLPSTSSTPSRNEMLLRQDVQLCVVCKCNDKNTLLFPCTHLCLCSECVEQLTSSTNLDRRRCPICREKIHSYMHVCT